jgi:hypothetical protein
MSDRRREQATSHAGCGAPTTRVGRWRSPRALRPRPLLMSSKSRRPRSAGAGSVWRVACAITKTGGSESSIRGRPLPSFDIRVSDITQTPGLTPRRHRRVTSIRTYSPWTRRWRRFRAYGGRVNSKGQTRKRGEGQDEARRGQRSVNANALTPRQMSLRRKLGSSGPPWLCHNVIRYSRAALWRSPCHVGEVRVTPPRV